MELKYNILNKTLDIFEVENLSYNEAKKIYLEIFSKELRKEKNRYEYEIVRVNI